MQPQLKPSSPPATERELLARCQSIAGLTLSQLATGLQLAIPDNPLQRKGWIGQAIELALGSTAKNKAAPDFCELGIELKTLPLHGNGMPAESTFVTSIPLLTIHQQTWKTSQCFAKLKRVLWMPVEGDVQISFAHRRIGQALLWSPSQQEEAILGNDWAELTWMITTGRVAEINATMGEYLQIRPKASNAKALCFGFDEQGNKIQTLPRGFYLRSRFTATILK